jgi:hypothetical protein
LFKEFYPLEVISIKVFKGFNVHYILSGTERRRRTEVKNYVEDSRFKVVATRVRRWLGNIKNTNRLQRRHVHAGLVTKAKQAWKFLNFNEDNPKHKVASSADTLKILAVFASLVTPLSVWGCWLVLDAVKVPVLNVALAFFVMPIAIPAATLEVLHIIYDR